MIFYDKIYISEDIELRRLTLSNAGRIYKIYSDAISMRYRDAMPHKSIDDAIKMIETDWIVDLTLSQMRLGIFNKNDQDPIGTILIKDYSSHFEVGISLDKQFWGKGIGELITNRMIEWFRKHKVAHRFILARVKHGNLSSIKLLGKCDFLLFKKDDQYLYFEYVLV